MEDETKTIPEKMTHPHSTKEYAEWMAEVFRRNASRNQLKAVEIVSILGEYDGVTEDDVKVRDWEKDQGQDIRG